MESEFVLQEFRTNILHLRPNGLISIQDKVIPQSSSLGDWKVADAIMNKEPGVGGLFTLVVPHGRFEARFKDGQWRVRTDIPAVLAALCEDRPQPQNSGVPSAPNRFPENVTFPIPEPNPTAKPPSLYGVIVALAVIAVVAVLGYYTFEEPINRMMAAHVARQETRANEAATRLLEAQEKEAYRALETGVRAASAASAEKIGRLAKASQVLAARVMESVGVSISDLESHPELTPREIDQLLRKNEAFLRAWNQVMNAHASERQIGEYREKLQSLDVRVKTATLQETDRVEADRLNAALDSRLQAVDGIAASLATVQEAVASKRLQEKMSQQLRNAP